VLTGEAVRPRGGRGVVQLAQRQHLGGLGEVGQVVQRVHSAGTVSTGLAHGTGVAHQSRLSSAVTPHQH
jgi:hypothetical protein